MISFLLNIDLDEDGRPFVLTEVLKQWRFDQGRDFSSVFLALHDGGGIVWKGEQTGEPIQMDRDGIDWDVVEKILARQQN